VVITAGSILIELLIFTLIALVFVMLQRSWKGKMKGFTVFGLRLT